MATPRYPHFTVGMDGTRWVLVDQRTEQDMLVLRFRRDWR